MQHPAAHPNLAMLAAPVGIVYGVQKLGALPDRSTWELTPLWG